MSALEAILQRFPPGDPFRAELAEAWRLGFARAAGLGPLATVAGYVNPFW